MAGDEYDYLVYDSEGIFVMVCCCCVWKLMTMPITEVEDGRCDANDEANGSYLRIVIVCGLPIDGLS